MTVTTFRDYISNSRNMILLFLLFISLLFLMNHTKKTEAYTVCNIPIVNTAPDVTIKYPLDNAVYDGNKILFNITTSKKATKINAQINGVGGGFFNFCNNCSNYTKMWELNGSLYQVCVYAIGNESNPCSGEVYYNVQCVSFKMNNRPLPRIIDVYPANNTNIFRSESTPITVYYSEDNLVSSALIFKSKNEQSYTMMTSYGCSSGTSQQCAFSVNTTKYPVNTTLEFYFLLNNTNGISLSQKNFVALINGTSSKAVNFSTSFDGDRILMNWNAEGLPNTYYIFTSNSSDITTFNFSNPSYTVNSKNWSETENSGEKYYIVRSRDSAGNIDNNSVIIGKKIMRLKKGLNLISIPLNSQNYSISYLIKQNSTRHPVAEISDRNSDGSYKIATFYPEAGSWWSAQGLENLEQGKGYWIKTEEDFNLTLVGNVHNQSAESNITAGINLLGWSSTQQRKIWEVINDTNIAEISNRRDDGSYEIATYYAESGSWWSPLGFDTLLPGKAYWVKASNSTKWKFGMI